MQELEKILEEIDEATRQEDAPIYCGSMEVDGYVRMSVVEGIIRKHVHGKDTNVPNNDGWIPVEERLPEDGTYLCTFKGELCGIEEPFTGMCGMENGVWDEPGYVTAWQPLPEPYRPERSEGE